MSKHDFFCGIGSNESKHQTFIQNYFVIQDGASEENTDETGEQSKFYAFREPVVSIPEPKVSIWEFLSKDELEEFLKIRDSREIRKYLDSMKMNRYYPKGKARTIFLDLIYSVTQFCKKLNYTTEKCGALMSTFYLTHILVTTAFDKSAEKVYNYFKELALCHTLPDFPPKNAKIFSQDETKRNMEFFARIYLRNLPLIRFVTLPNFGFYFNYHKQLNEHKHHLKGASAKNGKHKRKFSK